MSTVNEKMTAIANAIREKTNGIDPLTLDDMALAIPEVYDKGFEDGQSQGGSDEYQTALWDGLQQNGKRTDYQHAFRSWKNAQNFWKPVHDINAVNISSMFYDFHSTVGLPELCKQAGISFDTSKVTAFAQTFTYAQMPDVGVIDTTGAKATGSLFMNSYVKKAHLKLKPDGSQVHISGVFTGATRLNDLTIEGAIGNSLPISSPLSPQSMISVITHLVNYAGTDKEGVNTITFTEDCWTALEASEIKPHTDGLTDNTEMTWKEYVYSLGWDC